MLRPAPPKQETQDALNLAYRGELIAKRGGYEASIKLFSQALEHTDLTPEQRAIVLNNRGASYKRMGLDESALKDLDESLSLQPKHIRYLNNRAMVKLFLGDYPSSDQDFAQLLETNPNLANPYPRLWRFFALRAYDQSSALAWLNAQLPILRPYPWQEALALFHLGRLDHKQLMTLAMTLKSGPAAMRRCEWLLHTAFADQMQEHPVQALYGFERSLAYCPVQSDQALWARRQLTKLSAYQGVIERPNAQPPVLAAMDPAPQSETQEQISKPVQTAQADVVAYEIQDKPAHGARSSEKVQVQPAVSLKAAPPALVAAPETAKRPKPHTVKALPHPEGGASLEQDKPAHGARSSEKVQVQPAVSLKAAPPALVAAPETAKRPKPHTVKALPHPEGGASLEQDKPAHGARSSEKVQVQPAVSLKAAPPALVAAPETAKRPKPHTVKALPHPEGGASLEQDKPAHGALSSEKAQVQPAAPTMRSPAAPAVLSHAATPSADGAVAPSSEPPETAHRQTVYWVELGYYKYRNIAKNVIAYVEKLGVPTKYVERLVKGEPMIRLHAGPFAQTQQAVAVQQQLLTEQIDVGEVVFFDAQGVLHTVVVTEKLNSSQ
ncbi:SPOR domain-containing protein [Magnetococcus marinus]|uniref:SPOR domain-containing protein n=1 Tax=Magnetococcus marinus TaxID=1124597 RepID=UPI00117C3199|nr:SPOR domain-containing protein [Magnetococcus marinus]